MNFTKEAYSKHFSIFNKNHYNLLILYFHLLNREKSLFVNSIYTENVSLFCCDNFAVVPKCLL